MDSLLNEMKLNFKKGQKVSYKNRNGIIGHGTYLMAGTLDDCIVVTTESGMAIQVRLSDIDTIISFK